MADPRLNSAHFDLDPRRQHYRRAREQLQAARGWMTLALEKVNDLAADSDAWPALVPIHPEQVQPGTKCVLMDPLTRQTYPLRPGLNTIGRLPDNDIVLEPIFISRRHCVLLVHVWGRCDLYDTASRNGTFVNETRIDKPIRLHPGDHIKLGSYPLVFLREADCRSDGENDNYPETSVLD
jgi:hypothetical protein